MDATANDVPEEIQGFPTIKLFPAGKKDSPPIDYNGSRTIEDLAKFIRDSGTHGIDAYSEKAEDETDAADAEEGDQKPLGGIKEAVGSKASEAAEAIKTAMADSDDSAAEQHDEL